MQNRDQRWYGRRSGRRMTDSRQRLIDELLPRLLIDPSRRIRELSALFAYPVRDVWMEVGFGAGEHLAGQARAYPDIGFIGCEPYVNGMASLLSKINSCRIENIRVFDDDVRRLMPAFPSTSLGRLFILFSDPWPKVRHHQRRVTVEENLDVFARLLRPGAEFYFATDQIEFALWTLERLCRDERFEWLARRSVDWFTPPANWIPTRYDLKARFRGLQPIYLTFQRTKSSRSPICPK